MRRARRSSGSSAWANQGRSYRRRSGAPEGLSIYGFNPQPEPPTPGYGVPPGIAPLGNLTMGPSVPRVGNFGRKPKCRIGQVAVFDHATGWQCVSFPPGPRTGRFGSASGDDESEIIELTTCPEGTTYSLEYNECVGTGTRLPDDDIPTPKTPGAVPVRPENWDLDSEPYATYKIAAGDTFYGLAATYLGTGARWQEIWTTGRNRQIIPDPNWITTQGPIDMPAEARDRMRAWLKTDRKGKPGELTPKQVAAGNKSKAPYIVAAVVGVVAAGGLAYAIYKS